MPSGLVDVKDWLPCRGNREIALHQRGAVLLPIGAEANLAPDWVDIEVGELLALGEIN